MPSCFTRVRRGTRRSCANSQSAAARSASRLSAVRVNFSNSACSAPVNDPFSRLRTSCAYRRQQSSGNPRLIRFKSLVSAADSVAERGRARSASACSMNLSNSSGPSLFTAANRSGLLTSMLASIDPHTQGTISRRVCFDRRIATGSGGADPVTPLSAPAAPPPSASPPRTAGSLPDTLRIPDRTRAAPAGRACRRRAPARFAAR